MANERSWVSANHLGLTPEQAEEADEATKPFAEWTRADLNTYAAALGIEDADKLQNKAEVIAAIEEREAATEGDVITGGEE